MKAEQDFKLVFTGGAYGDCCCSYAVELHGEWTVQEFVKAVLERNPCELGFFYIQRAGQKWYEAQVKIEYQYGNMKSTVPKKIARKKIDDSQIYTSLDTATEPVLDALAINWKVDWYDTGYSVEQKRRIIKTALTVRRLMGTVGAVKLQADAIYPGTMLEEWFEYGGQPGTFRLYINVTDTTEEHPAIIYSPAEMERRLITAKRWSAHLESLSYMVRHTLATGCRVDKWAYTVPECGTIYCGVWWMPATLGYTAHHALLTGGQPGAFAVSPEFTGTLPVPATVGYSVCGALRSGGVATGYTASPEFAGTLPEEAQHGN